jgi:hypothetical protein
MFVGQCARCGIPATLGCTVCGRTYCRGCLDADERMCAECVQGLRNVKNPVEARAPPSRRVTRGTPAPGRVQ